MGMKRVLKLGGTRRVVRWLGIAVGSVSIGCQLFGGVRVEPVASSVQKPSNVAVYLSVREGDQAIYGLSEDAFTVHENGQALDPRQIGLSLLDRDVAVVHHAVVLVDLSGRIADDTEEPGALRLMANQLAPFIERLRDKFSVSLYGFDGSDQLTPLGGFAKILDEKSSSPVTPEELSSISSFVQKDSSSNLHGAVVTALSRLDEELALRPKPVGIGTLVIVARGPDLAARTKENALHAALDDTPHQVFAVTVGKADDTRLAETLGPAGYSQSSRFEKLEGSLSDVAAMLERDHSRYYLVSYCSPSRSGERAVLLEVKKTLGDGSELVGSTDLDFNATGFTSGCDPTAVPLFEKANVPDARKTPGHGEYWFGQTRATASPSVPTKATHSKGSPPKGTKSGTHAEGNDEPIPPPSNDTYAP